MGTKSALTRSIAVLALGIFPSLYMAENTLATPLERLASRPPTMLLREEDSLSSAKIERF